MSVTAFRSSHVESQNEQAIAIVGMACTFPHVANVERFWSSTLDGDAPEHRQDYQHSTRDVRNAALMDADCAGETCVELQVSDLEAIQGIEAAAGKLQRGQYELVLLTVGREELTAALIFKTLAAAQRDGNRIYAVLADEPDGLKADADLEIEVSDIANPDGGVAASLICAALALHQRVIPQTRPGSDDSGQGARRWRPWVRSVVAGPRCAIVNAYAQDGKSQRLVLRECVVKDETQFKSVDRRWPMELIIVSAADRESLGHRLHELAETEATSLRDVAMGCAAHRGPCRIAVCARSLEELHRKASHAAKLLEQPERKQIQDRSGIFWYERPLAREGRIAFVFPGEGSQYVDMLAEHARHFPQVRREFDVMDAAIDRNVETSKSQNARTFSRSIFPRAGEEADARRGLLDLETAVGSMIAGSRAVLAMVESLGVSPDAIVGHSSGEFMALLAARAYELPDDDALINSLAYGAQVATRIADAGLAASAVLTSVGGIDRAKVECVLAETGGAVQIAMDNCPHQVVLCGHESETAAALERLKQEGGLCERLPWGRAYHTPGFAPACPVLDEYYRTLQLGVPKIQMWSCATAQPFPDDPEAVRQVAVDQWRRPVRFRETIQAMYEQGVRLFIEIGPRGNLSAFISDTLAGQPHAAVTFDRPRRSGIESVCRAVGMLVAHGVDVNLDALFGRRGVTKRRSDEAAEGPKCQKVKTSDSQKGTRRSRPQATSHEPQTARRQLAALLDYQRTMREFLQLQEEAALRCFGEKEKRRSGGTQGQRDAGTERVKDRGRSDESPTLRPSVPQSLSPFHPQHSARRTRIAESREPRQLEPQPLLDRIISRVPGDRLVAECELSVSRHRFLVDHTFFGRRLSVSEPALTGLPVMPMAMTLELMAEAAAALHPEKRVTAMREMRTRRWLVIEHGQRRVRIEAQTLADGAVRAQVMGLNDDGKAELIGEGVVELTDPDIATPPLKPEVADRAVAPGPWQPREIYERILFHGPSMQGIVGVERCDDARSGGVAGVAATVVDPDEGLLFADGLSRGLHLPAALIDTAGQVAGLAVIGNWSPRDPAVHLVFPNSYERIEFSRDRRPGERLNAIATVEHRGNQVLSEVEMFDSEGRVALRVKGRVDELVPLPRGIYHYWTSPREVTMSRDITELFGGVPGIERCRVCVQGRVGGAFLLKHHWGKALAHMILDRSERETFERMNRPPVAKMTWLLGRAVAKDAARLLIEGGQFCMADVRIVNDAEGRPMAQIPHGKPPKISVAHKELFAVAAAVEIEAASGVGVDVERLAPMDAIVVEDSFSDRERALLEDAANASDQPLHVWHRIAWTAKEAAGKALGTGLAGGPLSMQIQSVNAGSPCSKFEIRNSQATLEAHARLLDEEYAVALCVIPVHAKRELIGSWSETS